MANIVFVGLGNMGYPMAGHLAQAGHTIFVANRSPEKIQRWLSDYPGQPCPPINSDSKNNKANTNTNTNTEVTCKTELMDAVILCVSRDQDVKECLIDNGIIKLLKPQGVIIDHSTTSATLAEAMAVEAQAHEVYFCDAPVSGGQQGAINGQLSIMVGCVSEVFHQVEQLVAPYTRAIAHMGPVGSGQKTKMVNQICVAGLVQALAEGIHFANSAGLDSKQVMEIVGQGAASSWQLLNRHQTMINGEYNHGFAVDLMHKDLEICLNTAKSLNIELPVTAIVDEFYQELQQQGHGDKDTSALLLRLTS